MSFQTFYIYAKSRDLDIDDTILACHFEAILAGPGPKGDWQSSEDGQLMPLLEACYHIATLP